MPQEQESRYFPVTEFSKLAEVEDGHWWFEARNALIMWALRHKADEFRDFLEIGCGTGFVLRGVRDAFPSAVLTGSEYHSEGLRFARLRIPTATLFELDATQMTVTEQYDAIGAFDVIEHILEDRQVLTNLARALRRNGSLAITVPQHRWLWSSVDEGACHVRRYERAELIDKIEGAGLSLRYCTSFVSLLLPVMWWSRKGSGGSRNEYRIAPWLNRLLRLAMSMEFAMIRMGLRFPTGGSLLLIAQKP
jgi:SAM-dependent methyltransferase